MGGCIVSYSTNICGIISMTFDTGIIGYIYDLCLYIILHAYQESIIGYHQWVQS
jgi:hypothetical protein